VGVFIIFPELSIARTPPIKALTPTVYFAAVYSKLAPEEPLFKLFKFKK
jgi:hypothetical protein